MESVVLNHRVFNRLEAEGFGEFYVYNNLDEWEQYLLDMAPEDEKSIRKMCRMMKRGDRLDQFEDAPGMRSFFDYINAAIQVGPFIPTILKYQKKTSNELIDELGFKNEKLSFFLHKFFWRIRIFRYRFSRNVWLVSRQERRIFDGRVLGNGQPDVSKIHEPGRDIPVWAPKVDENPGKWE